MYPVILRIGTFEITSFGVMAGLGILVGWWIFSRELSRSGLPEDAGNAAVAGAIGGLIGAKLLWTAEHLGEDAFFSLLFSRGGLSWFGGLVGGIGTGLVVMRRHRWPVIPTLAAATPALAVGHAIGRFGCFLVGDDYGRPSTLPWAVAFPQGLPPTLVPVHPAPLYEAVGLVVLAWMLIRWRRARVSDASVLGRYLVLSGILRFAIEFIRINERVALGMSLAQLVAVAVVLVGLVLTRKRRV
jgi:phosphatidylglycerol:prolipoprotein diacylglycerol transferase